jgi:hypothetical protein
MLSQYRLCAAGIGLGTAYSLKYKKGLVPMVAAGAVGTTADMVSTEDSNLKKIRRIILDHSLKYSNGRGYCCIALTIFADPLISLADYIISSALNSKKRSMRIWWNALI